MEIIKSKENKYAKLVRALGTKKGREEHGLYILEGPKVFQEVLGADAEIYGLLLSEDFYEKVMTGEPNVKWLREVLEKRGCMEETAEDGGQSFQVRIFEKELFKTLTFTENPQGILCIIKRIPKKNIEERFRKLLCHPCCLIALDSIQDPGNLGTIIRTAEAFGIEGIIMGKGSVELYNDKVLRSTMGSVLRLPILQVEDLAEFLANIKEKGVQIIGAEPHATLNFREVEKEERVVLVIGNEANGISEKVRGTLDLEVTIPMPGRSESLNAGIAAALMAYEFGVNKKE